jgi:hypothetical protein
MDRWQINVLGRFELRGPNEQEVALGTRKSIRSPTAPNRR